MAKYIKREWKKGKWVYTYKEPPKKKREFKYIKREWKKDHWEYTYPEDLKDKIKEGFSNLVDKAKDALGFDEKEAVEASRQEAQVARSELARQQAKASINARNRQTKDVKDSAQASIPYFLNKVREAGKKYTEAQTAFMNTPLGKIENLKKNIQTGAKKVADMLSIKDGVDNFTWRYDRARDAKENREMVWKDMAAKTKKEADKRKAEEDARRREIVEKERREVRAPELARQIAVLKRRNPLPELPVKKSPTTLDEDEEIINPNYDPNNDNTSKNCALCTTAYDLRRRGYDVQAKEKVSDMTIYTIQDCYKNAEIVTIRDVYEKATGEKMNESIGVGEYVQYLDKVLSNEGEGARGNLAITWINGGGHSIVWEVENGVVMIRDTQLNKKWPLVDYPNWDYVNTSNYIRTDNCEPTKKVLDYVKKVS